jgi:hypothetical protein
MVHNTSNSNTSSNQSTISASENQSNSKEVRQLEQKLRKKEEQLKIKEATQLAHYVFTTLQFGCCLVRSLSYVKITLPQRILDT